MFKEDSYKFAQRKWWVIIVWGIIMAVAFYPATQVTRHLTPNGFERPHTAVTWATHQLTRVTPAKTAPTLLVTGLSEKQVRVIGKTLHLSPSSLHTISVHHTLFLPSKPITISKIQLFKHAIDTHHGQWQVIDQSVIGHTVTHDSSKTLAISGIIAMPFLAILLFSVFGSVAAIALPLIIAVAGSEVALAIISLIETHIKLSVFLTNIVSFLSLGVGIDYALFISTRFRRSLAKGQSVPLAVAESMHTAGRSVFYSGVAVALAVASLLFGNNPYWQGLAIGGTVAVLSVLFATHTLLPAIMSAMGHRIEWGHLRRIPNWGMWRSIGELTTRHPKWSILISLLLLLPLTVFSPKVHMRTPANLAAMLPIHSPIRAAFYKELEIKGPGSMTPLAVVVKLPSSRPLTQSANWHLLHKLAQHLKSLPGVKTIASPTAMGLSSTQLASIIAHPAAMPASATKALRAFVPAHSSHLAILYVVSKTTPDSAATTTLLNRINSHLPSWVPAGTRAAVGGQVAVLDHFNQSTARHLPAIIASTLAVALLILGIATRSIVQALLGIAYNALVALATTGLLVLTVQTGHWGFYPQPLDSSITPLIFVLLFGLSMDYEVILLHRIQETLSLVTPNEAVSQGVATTGPMITGAGMIMVIVFLSLMISPLQVMKTLALGLSFAVLIDTWIVRSLLVPSVIVLLGTKAYWPWKPKKK